MESVASASATSSSSIEGVFTCNLRHFDGKINHFLGSTQSPIHPVMDQVSIRKEILKLVTNLSGSVAARNAEQGMLNLKQKYPEQFQDICLYSEVSIQLASYNFRLPSRRFLQELFLDLNFEPVS